MSNIAVLTSGGDSPGMNAAVTAVARCAAHYGMPLIGIKRGFSGLIGKNSRVEDDYVKLDLDTALDIAEMGGTFLRTARCTEFLDPQVREKAAKRLLKEMDVSGLVVIGGNGSFAGAQCLCELGVPCIGIPGTIDNDLAYTETTLGYDTAVNVCAKAIRDIRATCRSHDRPQVVEVMGRDCGNIALKTAAASGAEIVIVPEVRWNVDEVAEQMKRQIAMGNTRATIVVAEGCYDNMKKFDVYGYLQSCGKTAYKGEPMTAKRLANVLQYKCGIEMRDTVIGYSQRGSSPTARDAIFAFEAGTMAVRLLKEGISNQVIGMKNGRVFYMPINKALAEKTRFDKKLYNLINHL